MAETPDFFRKHHESGASTVFILDYPAAPLPLIPSRKEQRRRYAPLSRRGSVSVATAGAVAMAAVAAVAFPGRATATDTIVGTAAAVDSSESLAVSAPSVSNASLIDSLLGRSRKLRARFITPDRSASIPVLQEIFGEAAVKKTGVYSTADESFGTFHMITMRPFADKVAGRIGSYRIGVFPSERQNARNNPAGFLEVTTDNQNTRVSEHFQLRDFLTKDQATVWPKYLVLQEPLLDKLELVIDELRLMGVEVNRMRVMSGFRTPQYNAQGVGAGGRANNSRHQYGDAADVYIVNGTKDWMSDLNGDGRVDTKDAMVLAEAAERVERKYPELVGGIGIYKATSAHGPFVHIDTRGTRARWSSL
jgi:uncharacterized protein YcbK (DUF882 family)